MNSADTLAQQRTADGGRAFPGQTQVENETIVSIGMSMRDYFAAKAMDAIMSADDELMTDSVAEEAGVARENYVARIHWPVVVANRAYRYADAMLKAREAKP